MSSPQSSSVTRVLYKHVIRLMRYYDKRPALKALTINPINISPGEVKFHRINQSIEKIYYKRPFYLQPRSWVALVRSEFRTHSNNQLVNKQSDKPLSESELQLIHSDLFTLIRVLKSVDQDLNPNDRMLFDQSIVDRDPAIHALQQSSSASANMADDWFLKPMLKFPVSNQPIKRPRGRPPNSKSSKQAISQPDDQAAELSSEKPTSEQSSTPSISSPTNQQSNQTTSQSPKYFRSLDSELKSIEIKPGLMFASHPGIATWPFHQSVFLITDHDEKTGTKALIINQTINDPSIYSRTRTNEQEDQLWRLYQRYVAARHVIDANQSISQAIKHTLNPSINMLRAQPPIIVGGPVRPSLTLLHRLPAFADVSELLIDGPFPVYQVGASKFDVFGEKLHQAIKLIEQNKNVAMSIPHQTNRALTHEVNPLLYPNDALLYLGHSSWTAGQLRAELGKGDWLPIAGNGNHVFAQSSVTVLDPSNPPSLNLSINRAIEPSQSLNEAVASLTQANALSPAFPMRALWRHAWWQMSNLPSQSSNQAAEQAFKEFRHFAYIPMSNESDDSFGHLRQSRPRSAASKTSKKETDNSGNFP